MNNLSKYKFLKEPLAIAIKDNNLKDVKLLFVNNDVKTHLNDINSYGSYLFKIAIKNQNLDLVKFFVENGADITSGKDSVLAYSAEIAQINILDYLIKSGGDIHENDDLIFQSCVRRRNEKMIKYLLEKNVNMHVNDNMAIKSAIEYENINLIELYIENGYDSHKILDIALDMKNEKIEKYMTTIIFKEKLDTTLIEKKVSAKINKI